jgi:hypothetical protein
MLPGSSSKNKRRREGSKSPARRARFRQRRQWSADGIANSEARLHARATTHEAPNYEFDGVIHYCVANMPGAVPLTSSAALVNAALPYGIALARGDVNAMRENGGLQAGLNVGRRDVSSPAVAASLDLPFVPPLKALQPAGHAWAGVGGQIYPSSSEAQSARQ